LPNRRLAAPVRRGDSSIELSKTTSGWQEAVLHSFDDSDGAYPYAGLVIDKSGNLYGTTQYGGQSGYGTVFELSETSSGWQETVLHSFNGGDGANPYAGLIIDKLGHLYGTTLDLGDVSACPNTDGCGTVFELSESSTGWRETVLHSFNGSDGANPYAGLVMGNSGSLYGTTYSGGQYGLGTAFELSKTGSGWQQTALYSFNGSDGANPWAGLVIDKSGNLYGTTFWGGQYDDGTVFELSETSTGWQETMLYSFTTQANPVAALVLDSQDHLYGTTTGGGREGDGMVFEIIP
jgi:uncharacterized repeat protein (TIGR03803 family)